MERRAKPRWCLLYLIVAKLIALVALIEGVVPAGPTRTVLETFVICVVFGLMFVWLRANRVALDLEQGSRR
jgi:hypothetical protein